MTHSGTVVFTDIVGFTEFTSLRGDAAAVALLGHQESIVRAALPSRARVVKELGDGMLLSFDDPCAAVDTSLELQERFTDATFDGAQLWVRIGMHRGPLTRRGEDLVGNTVNVAARIVAVAGPGEVLVSAAVSEAVSAQPAMRYVLTEIGPVVMKGILEPIPLFRAQRAPDAGY